MSLSELQQHEKGILKIVEDDMTQAKRFNKNNKNGGGAQMARSASHFSAELAPNESCLTAAEYN